MRAWVGVVLIAVAAGACSRGGTPIATLTAASGAVEGEHSGRWSPAAVGLGLAAGDAIRTGPQSTARLTLRGGRTLHLAERSLARLGAASNPDVARLAVDLGEADFEGEGALEIDTPSGPARWEGKGSLVLRAGPDGPRFEALLGAAILTGEHFRVELGAGEGIAFEGKAAIPRRYQVGLGLAEMTTSARRPERVRRDGGSHGDDPSSPDAAATVTRDAGNAPATPGPADSALVPKAPDDARVAGAAPTPAGAESVLADDAPVDVALPLDESASIHLPQPPAVVSFTPARACAQRSTVELRGPNAGRVRAAVNAGAQHSAPVSLRAGHYAYTWACEGNTISGSVDVRRDSGTDPLPRSAPRSEVEADGRNYTLLYQTRIPAVAFLWPDGPPAEGLSLHVVGAGGERTFASHAGRHELRSGQLAEGEYEWWFSAPEGTSSERTPLAIRFDNASTTAQVITPKPGSLARATTVHIKGIALQDSLVSVEGHAVEIDGQGRFEGDVTASLDRAGIAIRIAHPHGGIRHYVRRWGQSDRPQPAATSRQR